MRPEYYADLYRRYNTFVKDYSGNRIYRIACGANSSDFKWTEVLMREVGRRMNGLSLHYYTIPSGDWSRKGSATQFTEEEWHTTLRRTLEMDDLIRRHAAIMDQFDPRKRVGLIVDEWGTWYDPEPGTHPGFLYQQNTLRDALVAALNFHVFHRHADRVVMANIAQTANVLQAMVLTDKERMLLTPTYHVFEMFKVHQDATLLNSDLDAPAYELDGESLPQVSASASRDGAGRLHVSLANLNPRQATPMTCTVHGFNPGRVTGRLLTADAMQAHNTFDQPNRVRTSPVQGLRLANTTLEFTLPPHSVVVLELE
jgi:alpha-N-arabinofuranosidase